MSIFDPTEAEHYCKGFGNCGSSAFPSIVDLTDDLKRKGVQKLNEGTPGFDEYRDCSLRDAERRLFLAFSHYRRSLDLMITSSAAWAYVTLYYSSFFAASALLELFGCYIARKFIVHVSDGTSGSQELILDRGELRDVNRIHRVKGSHERLWHVFYEVAPDLHSWITDPRLQMVLSPFSGGTNLWLTEARNKINYDTYESVNLMSNFGKAFNPNTFPACLQGELSTQRTLVHNIIELTVDFATQFGLSTDALSALAPRRPLGDHVQTLVLDPQIPVVASKIAWQTLL